MSRVDLAHAIWAESHGRFRASEGGIGRVERGEHAPRDGFGYVVARATKRPFEFFYEEAEPDEMEVTLVVPSCDLEQTVALLVAAGRSHAVRVRAAA